MLGYLLARGRVDVVVLEKHADLFRDFRGDTIHPSTLDLMAELGCSTPSCAAARRGPRAVRARRRPREQGELTSLLADSLQVRRLRAAVGLPQLPRRTGARVSTFRLVMRADATDLVYRDGAVAGVQATTPEGLIEVTADT